MRMKKTILIMSVICFLTVSFVPKKTSAVVLIDDLLIYYMLGSLVLATGVVAVSNAQVNDMGKKTYNKYLDLGGTREMLTLEDVEGDLVPRDGITISSKLKDAIGWVADNLPTTKETIATPITGISGVLTLPNSYKKVSTIMDYNTAMFVQEFTASSSLGGGKAGYLYLSDSLDPVLGTGFGIIGATKFKIALGESNGILKTCLWWFANGKWSMAKSDTVANSSAIPNVVFKDLIVSDTNSLEEIPYDLPSIKEGYTPTALPLNLPYVGENSSGVMSYPLEGEMDTVWTPTAPKTWDNVKDDIKVIPIDTPVDVPIDTPIDPPIDTPIDPPFGKPIDLPALNFSPLMVDFTRKFPFCIPFDVLRMFKSLDSTPKAPVFEIDVSAFLPNNASGDLTLDIDLTVFEKLFAVVRTFTLLSFVVFLIFKTREII